jgi:hypothetical protein
MCHVRRWNTGGYRKATGMEAKKVVGLKMEVTGRGKDHYISQIQINGKRIPEKAVLALAATLHRHHIR